MTRATAAIELRDQGASVPEIACRLSVSQSTVYRWLELSALACEGCGWTLREPDPEGICGFCIGERKLGLVWEPTQEAAA